MAKILDFISRYDTLPVVKSKMMIMVFLAMVLLSGCTKKEATLTTEASPTAKIAETVEMSSWKDEAGIVFNYDKKNTVEVVKDDTSYTNLLVKSATEKGEVEIKAIDTKYKSLVEWSEKEFKNGQTMETTLGGVDGLKVVDPDTKTLAIGVINDDILFTIKIVGYTDYWQKKINEIVDSFEFFYPTPAASKVNKQVEQPAVEENLLEEE